MQPATIDLVWAKPVEFAHADVQRGDSGSPRDGIHQTFQIRLQRGVFVDGSAASTRAAYSAPLHTWGFVEFLDSPDNRPPRYTGLARHLGCSSPDSHLRRQAASCALRNGASFSKDSVSFSRHHLKHFLSELFQLFCDKPLATNREMVLHTSRCFSFVSGDDSSSSPSTPKP